MPNKSGYKLEIIMAAAAAARFVNSRRNSNVLVTRDGPLGLASLCKRAAGDARLHMKEPPDEEVLNELAAEVLGHIMAEYKKAGGDPLVDEVYDYTLLYRACCRVRGRQDGTPDA